ncbi:hypothetical protein PILCRDRAFT_814628 [Piloderma croceum F 1598]|uniref:Uncharacterized protein n=1 Tax=Piloderma croceum (strain F 1598) TaxID=765440 RepID=A0A0C3BN59_PILCF|nr:hypothetical protein PILCRDRAFT_814628 [Piloderma croceum F 1598]
MLGRDADLAHELNGSGLIGLKHASPGWLSAGQQEFLVSGDEAGRCRMCSCYYDFFGGLPFLEHSSTGNFKPNSLPVERVRIDVGNTSFLSRAVPTFF